MGFKIVGKRVVFPPDSTDLIAFIFSRGDLALSQEKRLLQKYFDEINQDTGKYCFMVEDTLKGLDLGAVETLIVWDNLDINRYSAYTRSPVPSSNLIGDVLFYIYLFLIFLDGL